MGRVERAIVAAYVAGEMGEDEALAALVEAGMHPALAALALQATEIEPGEED